MLRSTAEDWIAHPTQTTVSALGNNPVTSLDHPAISICKENGILDPGDYLRSVMDNFEFGCKDGDCDGEMAELRRDHAVYSKMAYAFTLSGERVRSTYAYVRCQKTTH